MGQNLLALQFPGQGSQAVGMGKALATTSPAAARLFAQADEILGFPLSRICFEGPQDALDDTINTQPALLVTSVAAFYALQERLDQPLAFVAGHSLGEFSALVACGALPFEVALRLVRERGRLMKEAAGQQPGGMAAVLGLDTETIEATCAQAAATTGGVLVVANDNCPGQTVISGDEQTLAVGMRELLAAGARRVVRLAVSIPAHSPLMAAAADAFRRALHAVPLNRPTVPLVSNSTTAPLDDPQTIREALARQLTAPVRWSQSVRWMIAQGVRRFVEVGPNSVLTGLLKRIDGSVEALSTAQVLGSEV
jgi:[acyl-carrier-protein] S-malonyltransferase